MSFIINAVLLTLTATVFAMVGIDHYGSIRFAALMHPLSQSYVADAMAIKQNHARTVSGPKIVTVSGSSGLHGFRCEVFTRKLGLPCVNGGLPIDLSFARILAFDQTLMKPGDVVLLAPEYIMYYEPFYAGVPSGAGGLSGLARIKPGDLFRINLGFLLGSASETILASTGYRFSGPSTFTAEGDRRGHTHELAKQFADQRARETFTTAESYANAPPLPIMRSQLETFFAWAKQMHLFVISTIQVEYADWEIPAGWLRDIPAIYKAAGIPFIILPNENRYPRDCFWDASDHLNEECQMVHSKRLADAMWPLIAQAGYHPPEQASEAAGH